MDKNEKGTINHINKKGNECFQYAATVTLSYEEIKGDPQKITKMKPFINKYSLAGINNLSEKNGWRKFEKSNATIPLNILYAEKEKIYSTYVSKHNSNHEEQVYILIILNE